MSDVMPLFIKKFWTELKPDLKDPTKFREVDWVAYAPLGSIQKTLNVEAISRLSAVVPMEGRAEQNPAVKIAHARWNAIRPAYEAWKAGHEAPLEGTPLAVWPGISPEQAEVFRMKGVRTVEQIALLTDTHKGSMGIPGLHDIIENAKRFLMAHDKSIVTNALKEKDAEIADLRVKMAEQMEQLTELVQMVKEAKAEQPVKRGPGRPRKEQVAA